MQTMAILSSVKHISNDRAAKAKNVSRMDSQLMCAACNRMEDDIYGAVSIYISHFIFRDGWLSLLGINLLSWSFVIVGGKWKIYCSLISF